MSWRAGLPAQLRAPDAGAAWRATTVASAACGTTRRGGPSTTAPSATCAASARRAPMRSVAFDSPTTFSPGVVCLLPRLFLRCMPPLSKAC